MSTVGPDFEAVRVGAGAAWGPAPRGAGVREGGRVVGVAAREEGGGSFELPARVVVDATGYRAALARAAGLDPGFVRYGVGAEYDLYAPGYPQDEAVLLVGNQVAPTGYAW